MTEKPKPPIEPDPEVFAFMRQPEHADLHRRLGLCIAELQTILRDTGGEALFGQADQIGGKLDQIEQLLPKVRYALKALKSGLKPD